MSQKNSLIKVTYFLHEEESSVTFDPNNKLSILRNIISLSLRINFTEYDLIYNKKRISGTDDRILRELIGNDRNPVFFIKKRNLEKRINQEELSSNKLKNKVIIENFPSSLELYDLLNNFLKKNNYPKNYDSEHKSNTMIEFSFKQADIAYEFMKLLSSQKSSNPLYGKIKTTFLVDVKEEDTADNLNASRNRDMLYKMNNSVDFSRKNYFSNLGSVRSLDSLHKKKVIKNFYENQTFVRNSSPYMTYEEMRMKEEKENKKKWMNKYGFVNSIGKLSNKPHYVPNYVNITPSNPPVNHQFRDIVKKNWISDKGFLI